MNYCSYWDGTYQDRGRALYASMRRHCEPFTLYVLALDDVTYARVRTWENVTAVRLDDFMTDDLRAIRPQRTWQEFIWSCTAAWMLYIFEHYGPESLSYIDADCYFFNSPASVFAEISGADLAITPHRFPARLAHFEVNGLFNVGLVYAAKTERALACLCEWRNQCIDWCYYREEIGRFADQKYLDAWPDKWGAHIIQHLGANLAPWNQEQYEYSENGNGLRVNGKRIIWYHFHGRLMPAYPIRPMVQEHLYKPYEAELNVNTFHNC